MAASAVLEWFWRSAALRAAEQPRGKTPWLMAMSRRARIAAEVGGHALQPSGPWASGSARHLACGLFAESIAWSLQVASTLAQDSATTDPSRAPSRDELASLLEQHSELLAKVGVEGESLARLRQHLLERDFELLASQPEGVEATALELRGVAERLLQLAESPQTAIDRLLFQRSWRVSALLSVVAALLVGNHFLQQKLEARADLSLGKPWVASSSYEQVCRSPERQCDPKKGYFFHTVEESSPWLEVDLQQPRQISAVRVFNRVDCCSERALPLVVEVSTDHHHWREVVRTTEVFETWKGSFPPVTTRWVRLRVAGRSMLHLSNLRVLP